MHPHLPQRMEYCYAAAAQYGIEYRYPLLDVDLVETYLAFPSWIKQHKGINRYTFREAMKGFVPEDIRQRDDKSGSTIPQTHYSFRTERNEILGFIMKASQSPYLEQIFDFSKFPIWYEKLAKRDPNDMNYMMPGAFYTCLMIISYYLDLHSE
jgi:asparagine synthetase B (glutamine-hydrolysing)